MSHFTVLVVGQDVEAQLTPYGLHPDLKYDYYEIISCDTKKNYLTGHGAEDMFVILLGGEWYAKGKMGWWGVVTDKKDQDVWDTEFDKLVMSLPDDTLLTVVDCHI